MENRKKKGWDKNFNLMLLGQIVSVYGSALLRFGLSLYVLDITGRADIFALLFAISNIPMLLTPIGGAIADRFNRRNLMVIFDAANSIITLAFIILLLSGHATVLTIGGIMVLLSVVGAIDSPTAAASVPLLVEEDKLEQANGIVNGVQALSGVIAPVIGGVLYGIIGINMLAIFSGIAFFLAAVMEVFIQIPFTKREQEGNMVVTIAKDLKEGFGYVIKQPYILKSMIMAALLNLVLTPFFVVGIPIILRVTMESTEAMYGVGMAVINFSTILGALSIGFFAKKMSMKKLYRWLLAIALIAVPLALSVTPYVLGFGYYPSFILFFICVIPIAMAMTIISIFVVSKVQKKTPDKNLGKVMAIITAVSQCAAPVGQIAFGFLFEGFQQAIYIPVLAVSGAMLLTAILGKAMMRNEEEKTAVKIERLEAHAS